MPSSPHTTHSTDDDELFRLRLIPLEALSFENIMSSSPLTI